MFCGYKFREYATFTENSWNIKHGLTFFTGHMPSLNNLS